MDEVEKAVLNVKINEAQLGLANLQLRRASTRRKLEEIEREILDEQKAIDDMLMKWHDE